MSISIAQYKGMAKFLVRMKRDNGINIPLLLIGNHGIGKTQVTNKEVAADMPISSEKSLNKDTAMKLAASLHYDCVVLNLANQTPEDLLGYPDGKGGYIMPNWLNPNSKGTIYFLDEINRAPKYVLQCMFNFVNEGRIHKHIINNCDYVIAAGNPPSVKYDVTQFEDEAFLSRFSIQYLEPTFEEYLTHLQNTSKVHMSVIMTLTNKKDDYNTWARINDSNAKFVVKPDNRALERVGLLLNFITQDEMQLFGYELIEGMVGTAYASLIQNQYNSLRKIASPEEILNMGLTKGAFKDTDLDVITVISDNFSTYILENSLHRDKNLKKWTPKWQKHLMEYIRYIPEDAAVAFFKLMVQKAGEEKYKDSFEEIFSFIAQLGEFGKEYIKDKDNYIEYLFSASRSKEA